MPANVLDLAARVMPLLLADEGPVGETLRAQYARSRVVSGKLTGSGFFIDFEVDADVPLTEPRYLAGGDVHLDVEGSPYGGCVLHVRDGRLWCLEVYTFGDWREGAAGVTLSYPLPLSRFKGPAA